MMRIATRKFIFGSATLADPDPKAKVEEIKAFYSNMYPSLLNAEVDSPALQENGDYHYHFRQAVGSKG
jgi:PRTRC genetic system protein C